ncbi:MAG TPA: transketolase C-terminal domain-containing protein, partial [bacterium]|nr:transketolase C-terminal domain-containing protein [bacterium]
PFEIGKSLPMRKGKDALIVTTGITLKLAQTASEVLSAGGIEAAILHMPTIKPLDSVAILDLASSVKAIVTVEEHSIVGGLGAAVAEILAEAGFDTPKRFKRIGIPDTFPDQYGTQDSLMARYDITAETITSTLREFLTH